MFDLLCVHLTHIHRHRKTTLSEKLFVYTYSVIDLWRKRMELRIRQKFSATTTSHDANNLTSENHKVRNPYYSICYAKENLPYWIVINPYRRQRGERTVETSHTLVVFALAPSSQILCRLIMAYLPLSSISWSSELPLWSL